jgi:acyl-CoA reductase-like NAD-dependent aldehyde dehydrogenase
VTLTESPPTVLVSTSPSTGVEVARFDVHDDVAVAAVVASARPAAQWWWDLGFAGRRQRLLGWRRLLARRIDELAELMHAEGGKPIADATLEIVVALEHLGWAATRAGRVLRPRRVSTGLLAVNQRALLSYEPYGVVGVIGPWNYPVHTPLGSVSYALAAGNAVVFKPSEYTTAVGAWLANTFAEVVPEYPVLTVVTGFGPTGAALCRSGVDKVSFTGSTATGKRVLVACAQMLTPVTLECGGNDAMIVDSDADLDAAADAAVWGALSNAGQTCIGIERVYAVDDVFDRLLALIVEKAGRIRAGDTPDAAIGPITMPPQVEVIRRHIDDALARGARAVVGGPESVRPPYVDPVVLIDVPDDALANTEETFGPTLTVNRARDADEAVAKANASRYGLGAAVFGHRQASRLARRLRAGMVSINSTTTFAFVPALPFGGVGDSGYGRIHGADGLRAFARSRAITDQRFRLPVPITSFDRPPRVVGLLKTVTRLRRR